MSNSKSYINNKNKLIQYYTSIYSCSSSCYKTHISSSHQQTEQEKLENKTNLKENIIKNENPRLELDEHEDIIVPTERLEGIINNQSLRTKLKNTKLRKIIKFINSSKLKTTLLSKAIKNDAHLKDFVDEILEGLGYLKSKDKGVKIVNLDNE